MALLAVSIVFLLASHAIPITIAAAEVLRNYDNVKANNLVSQRFQNITNSKDNNRQFLPTILQKHIDKILNVDANTNAISHYKLPTKKEMLLSPPAVKARTTTTTTNPIEEQLQQQCGPPPCMELMRHKQNTSTLMAVCDLSVRRSNHLHYIQS